MRRSASVLLAVFAAGGPALAQVDTGSADFSVYVALGDSLTAGFTSGGLVLTFQVHSYPALIHRQATDGAPGFEQPLISEPGIPPLLELASLVPEVVIQPKPGLGVPLNLDYPLPYNNLAIPGATVGDAVRTVSENPFYDLILRGQGTQLQQAALLGPTFATVWLGNNDILGAVLSGTPLFAINMTPPDNFESDLRTVLSTLDAAGADIVVANIPDVTAIPFVTTLPPFVLDPRTGQPIFLVGPQAPLGPDDRVLLTAAEFIAAGCGLLIPDPVLCPDGTLPSFLVLDAVEILEVQHHLNVLNGIIASVAAEFGAPVVDIHALFDDIARHGLRIGGIEYTSEFLAGGLFSYDGVHPTALGYAVVANEFLRVINERFGGTIPLVDLTPFVFGTGAGNGGPVEGQVRFTAQALANLFGALGISPPGGVAAPTPPPPPRIRLADRMDEAAARDARRAAAPARRVPPRSRR